MLINIFETKLQAVAKRFGNSSSYYIRTCAQSIGLARTEIRLSDE